MNFNLKYVSSTEKSHIQSATPRIKAQNLIKKFENVDNPEQDKGEGISESKNLEFYVISSGDSSKNQEFVPKTNTLSEKTVVNIANTVVDDAEGSLDDLFNDRMISIAKKLVIKLVEEKDSFDKFSKQVFAVINKQQTNDSDDVANTSNGNSGPAVFGMQIEINKLWNIKERFGLSSGYKIGVSSSPTSANSSTNNPVSDPSNQKNSLLESKSKQNVRSLLKSQAIIQNKAPDTADASENLKSLKENGLSYVIPYPDESKFFPDSADEKNFLRSFSTPSLVSNKGVNIEDPNSNELDVSSDIHFDPKERRRYSIGQVNIEPNAKKDVDKKSNSSQNLKKIKTGSSPESKKKHPNVQVGSSDSFLDPENLKASQNEQISPKITNSTQPSQLSSNQARGSNRPGFVLVKTSTFSGSAVWTRTSLSQPQLRFIIRHMLQAVILLGNWKSRRSFFVHIVDKVLGYLVSIGCSRDDFIYIVDICINVCSINSDDDYEYGIDEILDTVDFAGVDFSNNPNEFGLIFGGIKLIIAKMYK
ncbi:hypothetical protein AYI68_g6538 [Smittium mucronatum]|uniref:Uncharacterized protein n=1 Tax=Smittium mucronatum TaxID=133383 RepID=A0A1R0GR73_9FUNG|nr:hypothetical protein AYI68_g6538 [Smittium mucronatum]